MTTASFQRQRARCTIPVYDVRLVASRKPLRLAEDVVPESRSAARVAHALIGCTDREHLACFYLNAQHRIVGAHIAAIGGQHLIGTVDMRVIFRAALAACASAFLLAHNHLGLDPSPSADDITTTAKIMRAGELLAVPVVDHVIVTRDPARYHSMLDRGTLPTSTT
jgi:DNA repair protein RadC